MAGNSTRIGLLVTRPADLAPATARRLRRLGFSALLAPALGIEPLHEPPPEGWERAAAVVATSPRAFLSPVPAPLLARPLFAVGGRTARAARAGGFRQVHTGPADAAALAEAILEAGTRGPLLHLAGTEVAGGLAERLDEAGVPLMVWRRYRARPQPVMPPHARRALLSGRLAGVLFYSARTAAAFRAWVDAELKARLAGLDAWGLSEAALGPVADLPWRGRHAVAHPWENVLLTALAAHYAGPEPAGMRRHER